MGWVWTETLWHSARRSTSRGLTVVVMFFFIECPKLPSAIEHGIVRGSGYIHGSLYEFSCLGGYSIVGEDILYCTEKGMWNGSFPKCLKGKKKWFHGYNKWLFGRWIEMENTLYKYYRLQLEAWNTISHSFRVWNYYFHRDLHKSNIY